MKLTPELETRLMSMTRATIASLNDPAAHPHSLKHVMGWPSLLMDICQEARSQGVMAPCENHFGHGLDGVETWNCFIEGVDPEEDEMHEMVMPLLMQIDDVFQDWMLDSSGQSRAAFPVINRVTARRLAAGLDLPPVIETPDASHAGEIFDLLRRHIESPDYPIGGLSSEAMRSEIDHREIDIRISGWKPVVKQYSPDRKRVEDALTYAPEPPILHAQLALPSGRIAIFSGSDGELAGHFHATSREGLRLPRDFSANTGKNRYVAEIYSRMGAVEIELGDAAIAVLKDGDVLRGTTFVDAGDLEEGGLAELELIGGRSHDAQVFMDHDRLCQWIGEETAAALVAKGEIRLLEVPGEHLHLYMPDGWRFDDFATSATWAKEAGLVARDVFILSPQPIDFDERLVKPAPFGSVRDDGPEPGM